MNSDAPITVHSWRAGTENKQFVSLQAAIEYARDQLDELPAVEILIRTGQHRYAILGGDQLAALVRRVCVTH
ncbi:hypothetical protein GFL49_27830 [Rhizobium leguminosarum bv. viciae]|nr:hypothetical protein [Rhizobium leguminosarum bv. viciae]